MASTPANDRLMAQMLWNELAVETPDQLRAFITMVRDWSKQEHVQHIAGTGTWESR